MDKKEVIKRVRKLTDCPINICLKFYNEAEGNYELTLSKVKEYIISQGQTSNIKDTVFETACYIDDQVVIQYAAATDFVLGNVEIQDFIEKLAAQKDITYSEELQSYVSAAMKEEFILIRSRFGYSENFSVLGYADISQCSVYKHSSFKRENHFRKGIVIDHPLVFGKEIAINAICYPHKTLDILMKENSMRNGEPLIGLLTEAEKLLDLEKINIYSF